MHHRTPGRAPRTLSNPLFAVNYVDRLLRHRLKEHSRESIAIGRQATVQMHRAWMFAYDHNCPREYRVKRPQLGTHAVQETIRGVWMAELPTPPLRWRVGQRGTSVRVPAYAIRDLLA